MVKNLLGSQLLPLKHHTAGDAAGSLWLKKKPTYNGEMLGDELSASLPITLRYMLFFETHVTLWIQGWVLIFVSQADSHCRAGGRVSECSLQCRSRRGSGSKSSPFAISYCLYLFYNSTAFAAPAGISLLVLPFLVRLLWGFLETWASLAWSLEAVSKTSHLCHK